MVTKTERLTLTKDSRRDSDDRTLKSVLTDVTDEKLSSVTHMCLTALRTFYTLSHRPKTQRSDLI